MIINNATNGLVFVAVPNMGIRQVHTAFTRISEISWTKIPSQCIGWHTVTRSVWAMCLIWWEN